MLIHAQLLAAITIGDRMFLEMQDFDFAQIWGKLKICLSKQFWVNVRTFYPDLPNLPKAAKNFLNLLNFAKKFARGCMQHIPSLTVLTAAPSFASTNKNFIHHI